jgi:hypothetical protein
VEAVLKRGNNYHEDKWKQGVAVCSKTFVEMVKDRHGFKVTGRKISGKERNIRP